MFVLIVEASDHHGDVAIVTGGARGIGYHITRKLVSCGMHVIIGEDTSLY